MPELGRRESTRVDRLKTGRRALRRAAHRDGQGGRGGEPGVMVVQRASVSVRVACHRARGWAYGWHATGRVDGRTGGTPPGAAHSGCTGRRHHGPSGPPVERGLRGRSIPGMGACVGGGRLGVGGEAPGGIGRSSVTGPYEVARRWKRAACLWGSVDDEHVDEEACEPAAHAGACGAVSGMHSGHLDLLLLAPATRGHAASALSGHGGFQSPGPGWRWVDLTVAQRGVCRCGGPRTALPDGFSGGAGGGVRAGWGRWDARGTSGGGGASGSRGGRLDEAGLTSPS